MENLIIELARYLIIFLLGIYTLYCFTVFRNSDKNRQYHIFRGQIIILYLLHFICYMMLFLAFVRIILCLLPQNDWTGADPVIWGIYRNIPFVIIGAIMVALYYKQRSDEPFKWMWLAITLSFLFYLPVVLWADVHPMIGMLMLPKTCMYIWAVMMGYKMK